MLHYVLQWVLPACCNKFGRLLYADGGLYEVSCVAVCCSVHCNVCCGVCCSVLQCALQCVAAFVTVRIHSLVADAFAFTRRI